ncbi:hypothetical protein ZEAMMB73_Zm00001d047133 [Zea mays]|nr:hypothetical protein ZEAMMB73_Zm00001d047133 [Zea mays]
MMVQEVERSASTLATFGIHFH